MVKRKLYASIVLLPILVFVFNEFLVYYLAIARCGWSSEGGNEGVTRAMIIADTHILGVFRGHWFDKLRREWQMYRSFQTAVSLLSPQAVFFLGDLMDEGLLGQDHIFRGYVNRFNELFTSSDVNRYVTMGNHDIGFHNEIFPQRLLRFTDQFNVPQIVERVELDGNIFILLNSMAFEGDGCYLCASAVNELEQLSQLLNCTNNFDSRRCKEKLRVPYSRPIVMQHFPLYRRSDLECDETEDMAPSNTRQHKFKPKHDCVSNESTRLIIDKLRPRAVFGGHIHYGCRKWWEAPDSFWEYTVSSFSWRNNHRPSFLLASISPEEINVTTCFLPDEYIVITVYVISTCLWIGLVVLASLRRPSRRWFSFAGWRNRRKQSKASIE